MISRKLFRRQPERFQRRALPVRVSVRVSVSVLVRPKRTVRPAAGRAAAVRD